MLQDSGTHEDALSPYPASQLTSVQLLQLPACVQVACPLPSPARQLRVSFAAHGRSARPELWTVRPGWKAPAGSASASSRQTPPNTTSFLPARLHILHTLSLSLSLDCVARVQPARCVGTVLELISENAVLAVLTNKFG